MNTALRTPQTNASTFDPAPAGWQVARIFAVIDLGTHWDAKWDKETHLVRIGFELPKTLREDGKPFAIFSRYTLSHHEKARLRKDLEALYGKQFDTNALNKAGGFDLSKLLDRTAFVNVVHSVDGQQTFANISALGPLPADMECPPAINKPVLFSLQDFNQATFDGLTEKTQAQIKESGEWQTMHGQKPVKPAPTTDDLTDDIPF